ncbi:MAG: hypothetical protein IKR37_03905, partial [Paludibacteraceae bacterium]|nr:hypothetical protein [Paludibacteraceae bacterium]
KEDPSSSGRRTISKDRWRIGLGDLVAGDDGKDETKERDEREHDNMLVAGPAKRIAGLHQFEKSVEGERAQNEEKGDKHRR